MSVEIHGHSVEGDPEGLRYLEKLDMAEAQTLFDEAKNRGRAKFQYADRHYELVHSMNGYVVSRVSSSFF